MGVCAFQQASHAASTSPPSLYFFLSDFSVSSPGTPFLMHIAVATQGSPGDGCSSTVDAKTCFADQSAHTGVVHFFVDLMFPNVL